jgi:hypothetical protein
VPVPAARNSLRGEGGSGDGVAAAAGKLSLTPQRQGPSLATAAAAAQSQRGGLEADLQVTQQSLKARIGFTQQQPRPF